MYFQSIVLFYDFLFLLWSPLFIVIHILNHVTCFNFIQTKLFFFCKLFLKSIFLQSLEYKLCSFRFWFQIDVILSSSIFLGECRVWGQNIPKCDSFFLVCLYLQYHITWFWYRIHPPNIRYTAYRLYSRPFGLKLRVVYRPLLHK